MIVTNDLLTRTRVVKLKLQHDKLNQKRLHKNVMYRNETWNRALIIWNEMYEAYKPFKDCPEKNIISITFTPKVKQKKNRNESITFTPCVTHKIKYKAPYPTWRRVRDKLTADKKDSDYLYPNHLVSNVCKDLGKAWDNYFNENMPDHEKPKLKDIDHFTMSYIDDQAQIKNGKLCLTSGRADKHKYKPIRFSESSKFQDGKLKAVTIMEKDNGFYVAIPIEVNRVVLAPAHLDDAVDLNCGFANSCGKILDVLPATLIGNQNKKKAIVKSKTKRNGKKRGLYNLIAFYQHCLAKKRIVNKGDAQKTKRYRKIRLKIRACYRKARNIQHDLMQKFTTYLVKFHDKIVIEDLDVKHMKMGIASKDLHRSMFGYFRQLIEYKCNQYGRTLIIADKWYPSTQVCPRCGLIKTGDDKITLTGNEKHHTNHYKFICYGCGFTANRDCKVPPSLLHYDPETTMAYINKQRKENKERFMHSRGD